MEAEGYPHTGRMEKDSIGECFVSALIMRENTERIGLKLQKQVHPVFQGPEGANPFEGLSLVRGYVANPGGSCEDW